jgi:hypothetical protein
MTKPNPSIVVVCSLVGWSCLWLIGFAYSWPTWWRFSSEMFLLSTSFLLAWAFYREASPET